MLAAVQAPAFQAPNTADTATSVAATGPGSFAHLLSAADAQRNADEAPAAPASTANAPAPGQSAAKVRADGAPETSEAPPSGEDVATDPTAWLASLAGLAGLPLPAQSAAPAGAADTVPAADAARPGPGLSRGGRSAGAGAQPAAIRGAGKAAAGEAQAAVPAVSDPALAAARDIATDAGLPLTADNAATTEARAVDAALGAAAASDTARPGSVPSRGGKSAGAGALLAAARSAGKVAPGTPTVAASDVAGSASSGLIAKAAADEARIAASAAALTAARAIAADAGLPLTADNAVTTDARAVAAADATTLLAALPGAPGAAASGAATATALPTAEARLSAPPGSAEFAHQFGAQLTTFVRGGVQHARLELHPLELGPVTVRIELTGKHAQVNLVAEHALTRQALEQALPALAGSLREAGLTLSGGGVSDQPRQPQPQSQAATPGGRTGATAGTGGLAHGAPASAAAAVPRQRGVVDLVA